MRCAQRSLLSSSTPLILGRASPRLAIRQVPREAPGGNPVQTSAISLSLKYVCEYGIVTSSYYVATMLSDILDSHTIFNDTFKKYTSQLHTNTVSKGLRRQSRDFPPGSLSSDFMCRFLRVASLRASIRQVHGRL
jgi:hypothetical protein